MRRLSLLFLLLLFVIAAVGMVLLGAFPPSPRVQPVEKVLPNDHFGRGS